MMAETIGERFQNQNKIIHGRRRDGPIHERLKYKDIDKDRWTSIASFKNTLTSEPIRRIRPFQGLACICMPESKKGVVTDLTAKYGLQNLLESQSTAKFFLTRQCYYIMHCFLYRANHNYPVLSQKKIMQSSRVVEGLDWSASQECIQETYSVKEYNAVLRKKTEQAHRILEDMKAAISSTLLKITGYLLRKVFRRIFTSVIVNEGQLQMLESVSKRNVPVLYVPLHRSHVDYLLVTWVLFNRNLRAPLVAAGDNLRIPIFGSLLRGLGGFFIKRSSKKVTQQREYLYGSILNTYICEALMSGYDMEFFIEGGRTRTGKPCQPKEGILSVICNAFLYQDLHDAYIVPVGINYDKLVDGDFIREETGAAKVPESFFGAVFAICKTLSTNHGFARIDFGQPISLKEFFINYVRNIEPPEYAFDYRDQEECAPELDLPSKNTVPTSPQSSPSLLVPEISSRDRKFLQCLSSHIVYDASRCQAIMSTNLLAWVLLNICRQPTHFEDIVVAFDYTRKWIEERSKDLGFSGSSKDVVEKAITLLGSSMVTVQQSKCANDDKRIVSPRLQIPNVIELHYYSNAVMPLVAMDSIVATCILASTERNLERYVGVDCDLLVDMEKVEEKALELMELLKHEFTFCASCTKLSDAFHISMQTFKENGFVLCEQRSVERRYHYDEYDFDTPMLDYRAPSTYLSPTKENVQVVKALANSLAPLIDTYYATACCLTSLLEASCTEKKFAAAVQVSVKNLIQLATLARGESLSLDAINNAIKTFISFGVIESHTSGSVKYVSLSSGYLSKQSIFDLIKRVDFYKY